MNYRERYRRGESRGSESTCDLIVSRGVSKSIPFDPAKSLTGIPRLLMVKGILDTRVARSLCFL